ncbi:MAG: hypothetical protein JWM34_1584 [Ilumatobacteraceae bacterium]|nr:hypothetical protein [Ilumatobacteraceae bacterium]
MVRGARYKNCSARCLRRLRHPLAVRVNAEVVSSATGPRASAGRQVGRGGRCHRISNHTVLPKPPRWEPQLAASSSMSRRPWPPTDLGPLARRGSALELSSTSTRNSPVAKCCPQSGRAGGVHGDVGHQLADQQNGILNGLDGKVVRKEIVDGGARHGGVAGSTCQHQFELCHIVPTSLRSSRNRGQG